MKGPGLSVDLAGGTEQSVSPVSASVLFTGQHLVLNRVSCLVTYSGL